MSDQRRGVSERGLRGILNERVASSQTGTTGEINLTQRSSDSSLARESTAGTEGVKRDVQVIAAADHINLRLRSEKRNPTHGEAMVLRDAASILAESRLLEIGDRDAVVARGGGSESEKKTMRKQVYFAQWRRVKQPGEEGRGELRLSAIDPAQFPDLNRPMEVLVSQEVGAGDILAVPLLGRERGIAYYPVTRMPNPSKGKEPSQPTAELPPPILNREHRRKYEIQQAIRAIEQEGKSPVVTAEMLANGILVSRALDPEEIAFLKEGKVVDRDSGEIRTLPEDRIPRIVAAELPEDLQRLIADEATRVQVRELRKPPTPGTVA